MKTKLFLLLLMIFFFTVNSDLLAQDSLCDEYDENCELMSPWVYSYKDVTFDLFPLCTLRVNYKYRQCGNPPNYKTQWELEGIHILQGDCIGLLNWWTLTGISAEKYRELKTNLIEKISLIDFETWYSGAPQWARDAVSCENGGGHYKSTYFQSSCTKLCYATFDIDGVVTYSLTEVDCIEYNACCGVELKYCKDIFGNTQVTHTYTGHTVNCYVAPWPDPSGCPENATDLQILWCRDNCLTLDE